jgi:predicted nucleic acid-binding protein
VPGVSNSSPLICLAALGDLDLLPQLFGRILIPDAVQREVVSAGAGKPGADAVEAACRSWLTATPVKNRSRVTILMESSGLDIGEAETIALAQEAVQQLVLVDDQSAVLVARSLGFEIVRTAAVYITAKKYHLIETVRPKLDALRSIGFCLKDGDYAAVLRAAGESPAPNAKE